MADMIEGPNFSSKAAYTEVMRHFNPVLDSLRAYAGAHEDDIRRYDPEKREVLPEPHEQRYAVARWQAHAAAVSELTFRTALAGAVAALDAGKPFAVSVPWPHRSAKNPVEHLAQAVEEAWQSDQGRVSDHTQSKEYMDGKVKAMRSALGDASDLTRPIMERLRDALRAEVAKRVEKGLMAEALPIEVMPRFAQDGDGARHEAESDRVNGLFMQGKCIVILEREPLDPGMEPLQRARHRHTDEDYAPVMFLDTDAKEFHPVVRQVAEPAYDKATHKCRKSGDAFVVETQKEVKPGLSIPVKSNLDGPCVVGPGVEIWGYMGRMFKSEQEFREHPKVREALEARATMEGPR